MNSGSLEYLNVVPTADHDISADTIQFSIVTAGVTPTVWTPATSWSGGVAKLLIGPGSPYGSLAVGTYNVYIKIIDSPESPVVLAGQLRIT